MDDDQQFCLRWNNHQSTLISVFDNLLENEALTDCTLAAEGKFLKAHKVVLSACSPYFAALLQEQYDKHPIFILKDIKYQELKSMIDYMYRGEVNICQDQLAALLKAAESLQIKGLSDNRSSSVATAPKPEHHRATLPTAKLSSGYTLEQTKRARIAGAAEPEIGSREGSCSPSRRRRKVRRRSIENTLSDVHDNSNSSQHIQQTQSNASGLGAITAAASALAAVAAATPSTQSLVSNIPLSASSSSSTAVTAPGTTLSSSKKTDIVKGTTQHPTQHDAMNTENAQGPASAIIASGSLGTETTDAAASTAIEKSNHKQMHQHKQAKDSLNASGAASSSELVIEPKAEYDDEANDEPVEDLTLDEDDVGMDDLDQNAGTSQAGEGSSQSYAPWQHDRSPDELLLATQEAQQRDPQDLTNKYLPASKENAVRNPSPKIHKTNSRSILNSNNAKRSHNRNSRQGNNKLPDVLYKLHRDDAATNGTQQVPAVAPTAGLATVAAEKYVKLVSPTSAETPEPCSIAAIAINCAASETASKNVKSDGMVFVQPSAPFHPSINFPSADHSNKVSSIGGSNEFRNGRVTAIPTSVVVPTTSSAAEHLDIKPLIHPSTGFVITPHPSVIKSLPAANSNSQAAALAAAFMCGRYHNIQQKMHAQELIQFHAEKLNKNLNADDTPATKLLESYLRQGNSQCDTSTNSDNNEGEDEDDSRYGSFEDIQLVDNTRPQFPQLIKNFVHGPTPGAPLSAEYYSDESQKLLNLAAQVQAQAQAQAHAHAHAQAHAVRQAPEDNPAQADGQPQAHGQAQRRPPQPPQDYTINNCGIDAEPIYNCQHCGKKYRWKSTLRRHENCECGGKEPTQECPYCNYKSKQRGNLGVHVRKHHPDKPQLPSRRRSKYSNKQDSDATVKIESNPNTSSVSDDSNSKLIIDCSK